MADAKLEIGQVGNQLQYLYIVGLDRVPSSPIKISIKHNYSEYYLDEGGNLQATECFLNCHFLSEKQAVQLPHEPFQVGLDAQDEIEICLVSGNHSWVWECTNWPELTGQPITLELMNEPWMEESDQPSDIRKTPEELLVLPKTPDEPPNPLEMPVKPPVLPKKIPEEPLSHLEAPGGQPLQKCAKVQGTYFVPVVLLTLLASAILFYFLTGPLGISLQNTQSCSNKRVLNAILTDDPNQKQVIESCKRDINCENLIVDLKTLATDTPAAYLLLGKSFDENSNAQLLRDTLSCNFDKNRPLAAMYYSNANKKNVPGADDLLKTLCSSLTGLDKDLASKECGF